MKLDTIEAAKRLNLSVHTLENWRSLGRGPAFLKIGNSVRYDERDLDAFEAACRRTSTAQQQPSAA